ncbi:MAG: tRNA-specific adenosine deaminase [Anaerolineaceae bacterium 4572_78]|nr:MAG: tRNA-specific adenosine deaminase [Anaerolineaceae bacterium 4572_78]
MHYNDFVLQLPNWMETFLSFQATVYPTVEERMRLVIGLAQQNIEHGTGGPFGAAIFDMETKQLLAPGVNLVTSVNSSVFHAEIVAIIFAQQRVNTFNLGKEGLPPYELVASTEPCAMCFGAVPWSGVRQLVCGACDKDARQIGFDEGPKLPDWQESLEVRGITVLRDVCRDEAVAVLKQYAERGGIIYNAR